MKNLPYIWINGLSNFDSALAQVEVCLAVLKDNADTADFHNINDKREFKRNLAYMKMLFERAELLARGRAVIL
jgi:hypothetical protein